MLCNWCASSCVRRAEGTKKKKKKDEKKKKKLYMVSYHEISTLSTRNTCVSWLKRRNFTAICRDNNFDRPIIYLFILLYFSLTDLRQKKINIKTYIVYSMHATLLLLKQKIWRLVWAVNVHWTVADDCRWCLTFFERTTFRKLGENDFKIWFDEGIRRCGNVSQQ